MATTTHSSGDASVNGTLPSGLLLSLSVCQELFLKNEIYYGERAAHADFPCHAVIPPPLEWAQRKDRVWITVALEDCKHPKHELKETSFFFSGKGGTENLQHEILLDLYGEIDPQKSMCRFGDRQILFTLVKKDPSASYWPRLTKESKKFHFIKTDFNRWKDEDDTDDEEKEDFSLDDMMNSMGGLNGGGDFGQEEEHEEDSDDEDLPDLQ